MKSDELGYKNSLIGQLPARFHNRKRPLSRHFQNISDRRCNSKNGLLHGRSRNSVSIRYSAFNNARYISLIDVAILKMGFCTDAAEIAYRFGIRHSITHVTFFGTRRSEVLHSNYKNFFFEGVVRCLLALYNTPIPLLVESSRACLRRGAI